MFFWQKQIKLIQSPDWSRPNKEKKSFFFWKYFWWQNWKVQLWIVLHWRRLLAKLSATVTHDCSCLDHLRWCNTDRIISVSLIWPRQVRKVISHRNIVGIFAQNSANVNTALDVSLKLLKLGSTKAIGREPKSCLGQVFNFKLGDFVMYAIAWYIQKHALA